MENNVFEMPQRKPRGPLPLLQAFLTCFNDAMRSANYTVNGAEATLIFQGRLIKMSLRDLGPAEQVTGFSGGVMGPSPDKDGA